MRMGWRLWAALAVCGVVLGARAQDSDPGVKQNEAKAHTVLQQMVQALGGDAWLKLPGYELIGRTSGFYQGNPTGDITDFWDYRAFPDHERVELGKKRQVVQIYNGNEGWEITYRGKRAIPKEQLDDILRRRDHSVETAVRVWLADPKTILVYGGQETVERHLADKVTLISASNDAIVLDMDAQTHLPLRRSFEWRDPLYKDKNKEVEEYDDYHAISGFPTPFSITRYHNGDQTNQRFLYNAVYGGAIPAKMFDVDATVAKIKK